MNKIKYLNNGQILLLENLIKDSHEDFEEFFKLGWSYNSIENHLMKKNNYSIAYIHENKICGFLLGEKILNSIKFDLEIYLMYVSKNMRRSNIGSSILKFIDKNKKITNISNIFLEVAENNSLAIKFYEKNNFVFYKFRHNYYNYNEKRISAKCYSKKI